MFFIKKKKFSKEKPFSFVKKKRGRCFNKKKPPKRGKKTKIFLQKKKYNIFIFSRK